MVLQYLKLRPTFEIPIKVPRDEAMRRLQDAYRRENDHRRFFVHGEYGELHIPPVEHRLWTPHLSFYVCDLGPTPFIHARFAPRLEVWTLVWVVYLALAFSAFFSFIIAYSQWAIGETTWWHWLGLLALLAILALYLIAHIGQQLSADQMQTLRGGLEQILTEANIIERQ